MEKIKFEIGKAKSGLYDIVDTNENPVRIICWDFKNRDFGQYGEYRILGLVTDTTTNSEREDYYNEHGEAYMFSKHNLYLKLKATTAQKRQYDCRSKATEGTNASATMPNVKEVCYEGLERRNDYEMICKHITNDKLSYMVSARLNECGWFVCDKRLVKNLIAELERKIQ